MTDGDVKIIEKKNGDLEIYDLRESLIETQNLAPTLASGVLDNYRNLLEALKNDTGFSDALVEFQAQVNKRAA
jgi:hypothetical protein